MRQFYNDMHFSGDQCPNKKPRTGYNPWQHVNGCGSPNGSNIPEIPHPACGYSFKPACDAHDACYGVCSADGEHKSNCDNQFLLSLLDTCAQTVAPGTECQQTCKEDALIYATAVKTLGGGPYNNAQKDGCQCCSTQ